ncbi:hypothetical protein ABZZ74_42790 [Streptomyces sp. NPDC006476]|uniref:hypothetical protein n=1 Tax=unclassified Streptomyces TaxID=2593676 RepID=UPI00090C631B|nr:hypothetical protein [Streptomyces sp. 3214.6]SHH72794.1 hypothetical protein SAMN05444521_1621 [Streptomyces sp. 3214.6]
MPNEPFVDAARALISGERFPPLILVGERQDNLVCLEGHLRLTAYALVGFPTGIASAVCIVKPQVKCLVCAGFGVLGLVVGG